MGDDGFQCGVDVTGVGFVVRTVGVTDQSGTHGETAGVPGTANCRGVRREGSEGVDRGVSREVYTETSWKSFAGRWFDGERSGGRVGSSRTRGQGVEDSGVAVMGVESAECGAG